MTSTDFGAFRVDTMEVDGQLELRLVGELDIATADRLDQALLLPHDRGQATVVLDLSALEFIDSTGLNKLVVALKRQRESGGDVVLRAPRNETLRVLEIVGLTEVFAIT